MKKVNKVIESTVHITNVLREIAQAADNTTMSGKLALGKLYEFNLSFSEAAKTYRSIPCDTNEFLEARARLAITMLKSAQPDQALEIAQELAHKHNKLSFLSLSTQDTTSIHTVIGDALSAMGREDEALKEYESALQFEGKDIRAAAMAARISLKKGLVEQASEFVKKVPSRIQRFDDILAVVKLASADPLNLPAAQVSPVNIPVPVP